MARMKETRTVYPAAETYPRPHHFTVAEYHQMIAAGVFDEDERMELIDGEIINMSPMNSLHAGYVGRLINLFAARFAGQSFLTSQTPVNLLVDSEPEPDIALLKPRSDSYTQAHPTPDDVLLLVEVSDSTIEFDLKIKHAAYARAGIRELWILNLPERRLEVFRDPGEHGYREHRLLWADDSIAPLAFPEIAVKVSDILWTGQADE